MRTARFKRTEQTETAAEGPITAGWLLFGQEDGVKALSRAISSTGIVNLIETTLGTLSAPVRRLVRRQLAEIAASLSSLDLADVLAAGWAKHSALRTAALHTAADPASIEVVDLTSHRITSVHRPAIDLLIDDVPVTTVDFELELSFLIRAASAGIRNGCVTAIDAGRCQATATLSCEGIELLHRQRDLNLEMTLNLDEGVNLLHTDTRCELPLHGVSLTNH